MEYWIAFLFIFVSINLIAIFFGILYMNFKPVDVSLCMIPWVPIVIIRIVYLRLGFRIYLFFSSIFSMENQLLQFINSMNWMVRLGLGCVEGAPIFVTITSSNFPRNDVWEFLWLDTPRLFYTTSCIPTRLSASLRQVL